MPIKRLHLYSDQGTAIQRNYSGTQLRTKTQCDCLPVSLTEWFNNRLATKYSCTNSIAWHSLTKWPRVALCGCMEAHVQRIRMHVYNILTLRTMYELRNVTNVTRAHRVGRNSGSIFYYFWTIVRQFK